VSVIILTEFDITHCEFDNLLIASLIILTMSVIILTEFDNTHSEFDNTH